MLLFFQTENQEEKIQSWNFRCFKLKKNQIVKWTKKIVKQQHHPQQPLMILYSANYHSLYSL
jgi:hypothetical protein